MIKMKAEVFRRLVLLALFNENNGEIKTKTELQKLPFFLEKEIHEKNFTALPYSYMNYHHGPYSEDLYDDVNFLTTLGLLDIDSSKIDLIHENRVTKSTKYELTELGKEAANSAAAFIELIAPTLYNSIKETVHNFGGKTATQLKNLSHETDEYKNTEFESVIFAGVEPNSIVESDVEWEELEQKLDLEVLDNIEELIQVLDSDFEEFLNITQEELEQTDYESLNSQLIND
ncbi:type II toxin-antitoxin system antitoxin SocA domain-containing protein [Thermotoga sp.]|uniref:type II toxin-antitoxin system antitoxin SocA domain-containing protein n=1 Tax=Thermotoga sp. TaxID=28240 RepID=UPI0025FF51ED|nr:type II toxin-antitoxin system antitoxin SocA domain-containing protein [Thermotoga sp.]MCD6550668.1 DUF4065 domain-containing protein [Thermotoga sp.]